MAGVEFAFSSTVRTVRWRLAEVADAAEGDMLSGSAGTEIRGVSTDTRTIRAGELFVALKGERFDGHEFVSEAVDKGAAAVMVSEPSAAAQAEIATIAVPDTLRALQRLARWNRLAFDVPVIGITGSCGKTTVKELAAGVLGTRFRVTKTPLNLNNEIGVPLSLLGMSGETEIALIELGANAPGEIAMLSDIVRPNRALITNIGCAHLEGFGTVETVAEEKRALVEAVGDTGTFYVNADDEFCVEIARSFSGRCVTFGTGGKVQWSVVGVEARFDPPGSRFTLEPLGEFTVPLLGKHNVMNAVAAAVVGADFGLGRDEIQEGLSETELPPMRMEVVRKAGRVFVNDAYNANPASMRAALETVVSWPGARRTMAVLGDMLELGEESVSEHRKLGHFAATAGVNGLILSGNFARFVAEGAIDGGLREDEIVICSDPPEGARLLTRLTGPGDVILLKGSRETKMEQVLEQFDALCT